MRSKCVAAYPWIAFVLCALSGAAQQAGKTPEAAIEKPGATGTVLGRVYLDDTKAPARKATVYLQPAAELTDDSPNDHSRAQVSGAVTISVQARFDGSFSFSHVPAGTYFIIASCPGYVSPYTALSLAEARSSYGTWQPLGPAQARAKTMVLKTIPRLTVGSSVPPAIDVTLERGGAISGAINYDDGSPAAGLDVSVLARMFQEGKETWAPLNLSAKNLWNPIKTDDRGNYRISGLPAGKYLVQVTLDLTRTVTYISSSSSGMSTTGGGGRSDTLSIYSGSALRLKDATSIAVDLGEERTGEDLRIPIGKLHTITGNIVSAHDGHVINGGLVELLFADDHSPAGEASSSEEDPGFTLNFISDGDYILTSPMSSDIDYQLVPQPPGSLSPPIYEGHATHMYGSASRPLHVAGDMDAVTLAVPEPTAEEAQAFRDRLKQQEQQDQP